MIIKRYENKWNEPRNNSGYRLHVRLNGEKTAPVVDPPAEIRFNGENLQGVFHHVKVWLHEVCRSVLVWLKKKKKKCN